MSTQANGLVLVRQRVGRIGALATPLAILAGFLGVYLVQLRIDERFGPFRATEEILYIQDGKVLKTILMGYENLAADLYWLRTVQYFGGKRIFEPEKEFALLAPLLEVTTDLDPHFITAYSYGAVFLSEPFPFGAGTPLKGVALIDKGIENNPGHWRLYLDKGFVYFWHLEDYEKAAEIFLEGSKIPGAPYWMSAMAGRALTKGGDRETARYLWRILYDTADNDQMRNNALIHLQQLDALDQIDALNGLLARYEAQTGHFPESWEALVAAGYLSGIPADPTGEPYVLVPGEKRAALSQSSALSGLP